MLDPLWLIVVIKQLGRCLAGCREPERPHPACGHPTPEGEGQPSLPPVPVKVPGVVINGAGYKIGVATWYNYIPGRCATWYLPKGTRLTVRDLSTGKTITCIISDREDHGERRFGCI